MQYDDNMRCSKCRTTLKEMIETGFLGCNNCYREFKEYLKPVIQNIHNTTKYQGKVPTQFKVEFKLMMELKRLQDELERASLDRRLADIDIIEARISEIKAILGRS